MAKSMKDQEENGQSVKPPRKVGRPKKTEQTSKSKPSKQPAKPQAKKKQDKKPTQPKANKPQAEKPVEKKQQAPKKALKQEVAPKEQVLNKIGKEVPKSDIWIDDDHLDREKIQNLLRSYRSIFEVLRDESYYYIGETNLVMKGMKDGCPFIDLAVTRELFDAINNDVKTKKDVMGRYIFHHLRLSVCDEMVKTLDAENTDLSKFKKRSLEIDITGQNLVNMRDAYKAMAEKITNNEVSKYKDHLPYLRKEIKKFEDFVKSFNHLYPEK